MTTGDTALTTRLAIASDAGFLEDILVEAINWDPARPRLERHVVLGFHENRHYIEGWPRPDDVGRIAENSRGEPVGATWLRFFTAQDPGYGFIAEGIPEGNGGRRRSTTWGRNRVTLLRNSKTKRATEKQNPAFGGKTKKPTSVAATCALGGTGGAHDATRSLTQDRQSVCWSSAERRREGRMRSGCAERGRPGSRPGQAQRGEQAPRRRGSASRPDAGAGPKPRIRVWSAALPRSYLSSTVAPAPSSCAFAFSASSFATFSSTGFGALSTRSLASFSPRLVSVRTSLMTWIFLSPAAMRMTSNSSCSSAAASPPPPPATNGRDRDRVRRR